MIDKEVFLELAHSQELLRGLETRHLERLAGLAKQVDFDCNQAIFPEIDKHGFFYLILEGSVALELVTAGRPDVLQTLHAGDAAGWPWLLDGRRLAQQLSARALTPTRVTAFDGVQLRAACESDPVFGYAILKALAAVLAKRLDASYLQLLDSYTTPAMIHG